DHHVMTEVREEARHHTAHAAPPADDGDRFGLDVERNLGPERGLVVAAREQEEPVDALDDADGEPQLRGTAGTVAKHFPLSTEVADADAVLALETGDLGNERHAARKQLQGVAV